MEAGSLRLLARLDAPDVARLPGRDEASLSGGQDGGREVVGVELDLGGLQLVEHVLLVEDGGGAGIGRFDYWVDERFEVVVGVCAGVGSSQRSSQRSSRRWREKSSMGAPRVRNRTSR